MAGETAVGLDANAGTMPVPDWQSAETAWQLSWARVVLDDFPAQLSEVTLLLAYVFLLKELAFNRQASCEGVSVQCIVTYALVNFTRMWFSRWSAVLGFWLGDVMLNLFSIACCAVLLLRLGVHGVAQATFGAALIHKLVPQRVAPFISCAFLYMLAAALAAALHYMLPIEVLEDDARYGVTSFADDMHQAIDTIAILPQFALFLSQHRRMVPQVIVLWILGLAASRFFAMVSGLCTVIAEYLYVKEINTTQCFFTLGQLFNVAILADFVYYYFTSKGHRACPLHIELPI